MKNIETQPCSSASPPPITTDELLEKLLRADSTRTYLPTKLHFCVACHREQSALSVTIDKILYCSSAMMALDQRPRSQRRITTAVMEKHGLPPRAPRKEIRVEDMATSFSCWMDTVQFPSSGSPGGGWSGRVCFCGSISQSTLRHSRIIPKQAATEGLFDYHSRVASHVKARYSCRHGS
jgi:hypothetical protein